jgi:hypothetical protein
MTSNLRAEYERSEYAQRKRQHKRERLLRFLALRKERETFMSIPKSKRRWDVNLSRWVEQR